MISFFSLIVKLSYSSTSWPHRSEGRSEASLTISLPVLPIIPGLVLIFRYPSSSMLLRVRSSVVLFFFSPLSSLFSVFLAPVVEGCRAFWEISRYKWGSVTTFPLLLGGSVTYISLNSFAYSSKHSHSSWNPWNRKCSCFSGKSSCYLTITYWKLLISAWWWSLIYGRWFS